MNRDKIIQELVDFVEGKMGFDDFYEKLNLGLYDVLLNEKNSVYKFGTPLERIQYFNSKSAKGRCGIFNTISSYLKISNYQFKPTKKYYKEYKFLVDIQPSYIWIDDEEVLKKYIEKAPITLKLIERKKCIKNMIKQDFKYDKTPPRWAQDPEWPIVNGVPLVFKKQSKMTLDDERVFYTFYHPETLKETIIVQFF